MITMKRLPHTFWILPVPSHDHLVSHLAKASLVSNDTISGARGLNEASPSHFVEGLVDDNDTTSKQVSDSQNDSPIRGVQVNSSLVFSGRNSANNSVQAGFPVLVARHPLSPQVHSEIKNAIFTIYLYHHLYHLFNRDGTPHELMGLASIREMIQLNGSIALLS